MIVRRNASALIVLAYWAASLVARVEEKGCWFLRGAARFVLVRVMERLSGDRGAVREFVEDL